MKLSNIKPLSYVKAHAPEILEDIAETQDPVVITVRGEAVAVLQDMRSYQQTQQTMMLWRSLSLTAAKVKQGDTFPVKEAFARIHKRTER
jgi:prevent-host-death family protein